MNLKKVGKVFTSKFVGTGPSSFKKRMYRAVVSQRLRNTVLMCFTNCHNRMYGIKFVRTVFSCVFCLYLQVMFLLLSSMTVKFYHLVLCSLLRTVAPHLPLHTTQTIKIWLTAV